MGIFSRLFSKGSAETGADFVEIFPELCVVGTDLDRQKVLGADEDWLENSHLAALCTYLHIAEPEEARALVKKYRAKAGFQMRVLAEASPLAIVGLPGADNLETLARVNLGNKSGQYRSVSVAMEDIYGKTGMLRFFWFFHK